MATNYTASTPILGVNLEGIDSPGVADPLIVAAGTGGPRIPVLNAVFISGNRTALYVIAKAALNPASTVVFDTVGGGNGTVVATTGDASGSTSFSAIQFMVTLNIATCATGDYIWARTSVNLYR